MSRTSPMGSFLEELIRLHFQHVHVAGGLLLPSCAKRCTNGAPDRLGYGFRVSPLRTRQGLKCLHRSIIGDFREAAPVHLYGRNPAEHYRRIGEEISLVAYI